MNLIVPIVACMVQATIVFLIVQSIRENRKRMRLAAHSDATWERVVAMIPPVNEIGVHVRETGKAIDLVVERMWEGTERDMLVEIQAKLLSEYQRLERRGREIDAFVKARAADAKKQGLY